MDIDQDNIREDSVLDESSNSAEQMVLTSPVKCGNAQDVNKTADSCSRTDSKMHAKELTVDEANQVCKSETSVKVEDISTSFSTLCESEKATEQLKTFSDNPDEREDGFESSVKAADKDSSEIFPRTIHLEHNLPASAKSEDAGPKVKDKYERNLKTFLVNAESRNAIRSRMTTKVSEKVIKSDSEISKTVDFSGNVSKISAVLSKMSLGTSSAPPTFNTLSGQIPQKENLSNTPYKTENDTSNLVSESSKIVSTSENPEPFVSDKTENYSLSAKVLDSRQDKSPGVFKLPTIPTCLNTTPKFKNGSPETSKIKDSATTPAAKRPTDFNVKTRRAFYTFSPNSTTGVLRQCQSLPNINRPQRRQQKQRWSVALDQRSRIVRSLFSDNSEPSTSEKRQPSIPNNNTTGSSRAASSRDESKSLSQETSSLAKVPGIAVKLDHKSKICRKLTFALPVDGESEKAATTEEAANAPKGKPESPVKRKEVGSDLAECSSSSLKKVRIALEFKKSDEDTSIEKMVNVPAVSEEVPKDYLKPTCISGKKVSPAKRKAQEVAEGPFSSKTKATSSKIISKR